MSVIATAFLLLAALQVYRSRWMQHEGEVGRLNREIQMLALEEQSTLRGSLTRHDGLHTATPASLDRRLDAALDSMVRMTADDPAQHARALAAQRAIVEWRRRGVGSVRATGGSGPAAASPVLATEAALFDTAQALLRNFLADEELLYRQRVQHERAAFRLTVAFMSLGLLVLLLGLGLMRRRMLEQMRAIVAQASELGQRNSLLQVQGTQLELQNEELRLQTEQLQDQAVELEDQAATLEEQEAELALTLDELRGSEERFRTVVNSMSDMVFTMDREQRYEQLFGNWVEREGVEPAMVIGHTPEELFGADAAVVHRHANEQALRGVPTIYEWNVSSAGADRHFTTAVSPLRDGHGDVFGVVGVTRDVTEQHAREARHRATEEQLRHTQRLDAIGQLAGGVAHDFNNLLTVVLSYCDMIRMDLAPGDPAIPMLAEIQQAALQGAKLTGQLLAVGRQQVMRLELLDMNAVVRRTEQMLRRLIDTSIDLRLRLLPEPAVVRADAPQIEQILLNLAINSRDAMPQGGTLTIETAHATREPASPTDSGIAMEQHVLLTVTDTGSGMSPEILARVFEPFFTTKAVGHGTGLGLATVHGIVRQSGGQIDVSSEPGRGTVVRIHLPRADASAEELAQIADADAFSVSPGPSKAAAAWDTTSRAPTGDATLAAPGVVLLVDDEHSVRHAAARMLTREGHTVIEVASAIDALHVLEKREQHVDLVVSDIVMPHMSGRELAYEVRVRFPNAGIVLMSGYSKERALHDDALGLDTIFLDKPFTMERFIEATREGLAAARRRAQREPAAGRSVPLDERPVAVIVNSVDAIVWEADARTGRFHYVNRRAESMLGYPIARWREAAFFASIVHPADRSEVAARRGEAVRTATGFIEEYRVVSATGETFWIRDQVQVVSGEDGRVTQLRGVMFDITVNKRADEELRLTNRALERERAFLSALLDNLSDGIVACDEHGTLTMFNSASRSLYGRLAEPVRVQDWAEHFELFHGDGVTLMRMEEVPLYRALRGEWVNNVEMIFAPRAGPVRSLLASGRPFGDATGDVRGAVVAFRDVTEIKRAERELVRARDAAERASLAKTQFLSLVSHELRTPLTAVIGFAAVLRKNRHGVLGGDELTYLDRIGLNGRVLLGLVDDLLELTSIESGGSEVRMEPVSLQEMIPQALGEFQERARLASVTLRSHADESLYPIHADPDKLRLLITKLVDNALKFTTAGSVEVRVVAEPDGRTARRIDIIDTGIGVEPERLEAVFAPFEQGGQFTVRQHGGIGLGLHLARRYCELMGFSIAATSEPGVGSVFSIELRPTA
ncbi:MAG TPA: ATP-binding protein [Gemmatimonadaceae bacterium]|nr:ATP-binding protein [Gemmatimonadaceae bacterium]